MERPRVFVTRRIPEAGLARILNGCEAVVWPEELPPSREVMLREVAKCDGLVSLVTDRVDAELLQAAPRLRVVSNFAVGYDNIDVPACTAHGVIVGNTPGVLTETSADLAFALMASVARRIVEGVKYVESGQWQTWGPLTLIGQDLHGTTLGILGLGRIGAALARRARGFNMRLLYNNRVRRQDLEAALGIEHCDMNVLLRDSDFVSVHVPYSAATHHLINRERLRRMKPNAILINTARGGVVDPEALYEALRDGVIWGAGLDVTDPEPINMDSPLLTLPNCVVVPHIASASVITRDRMAMICAENLLAGLSGQPMRHAVNPEVRAGGAGA